MTHPDKFSEAGKQQLASQLDFFQTLTSRAFENAERILALNLEATRATLDQTSGAVRQLAAARDPRDLLALGNQSQQHVEAVMAYSRKLFEITSKAAPAAAAPEPAPEPASAADSAPAPAPEEHIDTAAPAMVNEPVAEPEPEPAPEPAASAVQPSEHPLGEADVAPEPAPAIAARATPIAEAVSHIVAVPVEALHPVASPIPDAGPIAVPAIAPVDAEPPAPVPPKRSSGAAAKGSRKR
jgi:phasin family protein